MHSEGGGRWKSGWAVSEEPPSPEIQVAYLCSARTYLERHFLAHVRATLRNVQTGGAGSGLVGEIERYFQHQTRADVGGYPEQYSDVLESNVPLWPVLYLLLRAGAYQEFAAAVQRRQYLLSDAFVTAALQYAAHPCQLTSSARERLTEEYSLNVGITDAPRDPYMVSLYNVICGADPGLHIPSVCPSLHDFLWTNLAMLTDLREAGAAGGTSLSDLQTHLDSFGLAHFNAADTKSARLLWSLCLIVTAQPERAVAALEAPGLLFEAAAVAAALRAAGLLRVAVELVVGRAAPTVGLPLLVDGRLNHGALVSRCCGASGWSPASLGLCAGMTSNETAAVTADVLLRVGDITSAVDQVKRVLGPHANAALCAAGLAAVEGGRPALGLGLYLAGGEYEKALAAGNALLLSGIEGTDADSVNHVEALLNDPSAQVQDVSSTHTLLSLCRARISLPEDPQRALRYIDESGLLPLTPELRHVPGYATQCAGTLRTRPKTWRMRGMTRVMLQTAMNKDVYSASVSPLVQGIVDNGTTACCFCYGHTGAGKTHTIMGYRGEAGLYSLAAAALCDAIRQKDAGLMLQIRFAEIYNGKVYDLLNHRAECTVRQGSDGKVHIRAGTVKDERGAVTVHPLHALDTDTQEGLDAIVSQGMQVRQVGSSSLHDESSRSHALLYIEIVNRDIISIRDAIIRQEGELTRVGKLYEDRNGIEMAKVYKKDEHGKLLVVPREESGVDWDGLDRLREARDHEQCLLDDLRAQEGALTKECRASGGCIGGTLVLVDLAGAEYGATAGKQVSPKQRREGQEINKTLLALKECVRGMSSGAKHIPFRNSKLTMVLRQHLQAEHSRTIMVANISPSAQHLQKTVNTLQYAALVAEASK
ncbi:kinesin-like protein [Kipferlia bialata]|uniref:Multifunctional fusion protein n=1 Tax=Kipferlia bialata TaxID=797122 RepID=A0A9K3CRS5_9EUKA|nr:kinesin-like protein [Kipferlia bialata]|eukprot:g3014.t1